MAKKNGRGGNGNGDEPVGYGKPPKGTQFQPGVSGNPRGRRKGVGGRKSILGDLRRIMSQKMTAREGDKVKLIEKSDAVIHGLFSSAAKGNPAVARLLFSLMREEEEASVAEPAVMDLSPESLETLRRYLKRRDEEQDGQ